MEEKNVNRFDVKVYVTTGDEFGYYVETNKNKKEIMADINAAWNNDRSIQINYKETIGNSTKENVAIFDNKKVVGIDIKEALSLDEMIKNIDFKAHVMSVPCEQIEKTEISMDQDAEKPKRKWMSGKEKLDDIKNKLW